MDRLKTWNKRRKFEDCAADFFQGSNFSINEINEYCKSLARKFAIDWMSVLCTDWLSSLLLQYLTLAEITRLDSAICCRKLRPEWLNNLKKCISLVTLRIFDSVVWSNILIDWIVARNLHFSELSITKGYSKITNEGMYRLAQQCPELKRLKICTNRLLKNDKRIQCLTSVCCKLQFVEIKFPLSSQDCVWLGSCEQLQSIKICTYTFTEPADIKALFKNKKMLKTLVIKNGCNAQVLSELGANCPMLEVLDICMLTDPLTTHIKAFTQGCTKLKLLKVNQVDMESEVWSVDLLNKLIEGLGKNCPLLEALNFNTEYSKSVIAEAALKSLAQGCPSLRIFHLGFVETLSAPGVKHLVDHCTLLTDIGLIESTISDEVLVELGKMKSLTSLKLTCCSNLTDVGIDALVKSNGSSLKLLHIANCEALTDTSLTSISEHCPNLCDISVGSNEFMTSLGMLEMVEDCQKLISFDNDGLNSFEMDIIQDIVDSRKCGRNPSEG